MRRCVKCDSPIIDIPISLNLHRSIGVSEATKHKPVNVAKVFVLSALPGMKVGSLGEILKIIVRSPIDAELGRMKAVRRIRFVAMLPFSTGFVRCSDPPELLTCRFSSPDNGFAIRRLTRYDDNIVLDVVAKNAICVNGKSISPSLNLSSIVRALGDSVWQ